MVYVGGIATTDSEICWQKLNTFHLQISHSLAAAGTQWLSAHNFSTRETYQALPKLKGFYSVFKRALRPKCHLTTGQHPAMVPIHSPSRKDDSTHQATSSSDYQALWSVGDYEGLGCPGRQSRPFLHFSGSRSCNQQERVAEKVMNGADTQPSLLMALPGGGHRCTRTLEYRPPGQSFICTCFY